MQGQYLEFVLKARDEASAVVSRFRGETEQLTSSFNSLNPAVQSAMSALSAYAGTQGLLSIIHASEEAGQQLAQSQFFLNRFSKNVDGDIATLQKWATGVQNATGIGDDYAVLVGAKMAGRIKDVNKAMEYSNTLFKLQRLGLVNASDAANMLIRASDGNTRALRFMLEQMGFSVPAFASLETIFKNLEAQLGHTTDKLNPFTTGLNILKEAFGNIFEKEGAPLAEFFGGLLGFIGNMLEKHPMLASFVGLISVLVTGLAALGGAIILLKPAVAIFAGIFGAPVLVPLLLLVGTILFAMWAFDALGLKMTDLRDGWVALFTNFGDTMAAFRTMLADTFGGFWSKVLIGALGALLLVLGAMAFGILGFPLIVFAALGAIAALFITHWDIIKKGWNDFIDYLGQKIYDFSVNVQGGWEIMTKFLSDKMLEAKNFIIGLWDGIVSKVQGVIDFLTQKLASLTAALNSAASAVASPFKAAGSFISGAVQSVFGKGFADGGTVSGGRSYLVGERGPEIFTPSATGRITPNGGIGGGITVNINGGTYLDKNVALDIGNMIVRQLQLVSRISA